MVLAQGDSSQCFPVHPQPQLPHMLRAAQEESVLKVHVSIPMPELMIVGR